MPKQAVGANLVYFDLWNATGSGGAIELITCTPVVSGAVAVTGVVGLDLFLTRTSAVGTTGTAATYEGTDPTAATICAVDGNTPCNRLITARLTPGGGATAGAVLEWCSVYSEETNGGTYVVQPNLARSNPEAPSVIIAMNQGIRVVQGSVASVGNIGFNVAFRTLG
jgi:sugar (pentulose or hexulose) kinase